MIKRIFIILLAFFLYTSAANSQGFVTDALELSRHFTSSTSVTKELKRSDTVVLNILNKYAPAATRRGDIYSIYDSVSHDLSLDPNPFINISGGSRGSSDNIALSGPVKSGIGSIISNIGGLDVTNIADGLAKFLVERTKQELSVAFFDKFQETLQDEKYADLVMLFPQTAQLLNNIGTEVYQFSTYLQALREAFIQDLNNLFQTFPQVINQSKYDSFFNRPGLEYLRPVLNSALYITRQLKNDVHPVALLNNFPADTYFPYNRFNHTNGIIKSLQLFSASLSTSDTASRQHWISSDSLWMLINDTAAFKLYLGLVYQEAAKIRFDDSTTLQTLLNNIARHTEGIRKYADFIIALYEKGSTVEDYIRQMKDKKKNNATLNFTDYYNYFNAVTDLFKVISFSDRLTGLQQKVDKVYRTFTFVAGNANNIYIDITQKNYSSAVMNIVSVFDSLLNPVYSEISASASTASAMANPLPKIDKYAKFRAALMKYGAFMAQVTSAKSSDDVKKAIESAALPVGSASIKKHASFNIALNAYVGPFYGRQKMASDKDFVNAGGMYSPVGVSFSKGIGSTRNPGSISLFTSLIDIGALTTFRFSNPNDTLAGDIKIKLSQIVAPGVHLIFGVPKWPVSFGGGYQWTPLLSKVEQSAATLNDSKGKRWQLFIAVDLPLLNFYNKSR